MHINRELYLMNVESKNGKYYYTSTPNSESVEIIVGKTIKHPKNKKKSESCFNFNSFYDFKITGKYAHVAIIQCITPAPVSVSYTMFNGQPSIYTKCHNINKRNGYSYNETVQVNRIMSLEELSNLPETDPLHTNKMNIRCPVFKMMKSSGASYGTIFKTVKKHGSLINKVTSPGKDLEFVAIRQDPHAIRHIAEQSQDLQIAAITSDPKCLEHTTDPSFLTLLLAVALDPNNLDLIEDPPEIFKRVASTVHV